MLELVNKIRKWQFVYAQEGDLHKLLQTVFLQAHAGFGQDCMRSIVVELLLKKCGAIRFPDASCRIVNSYLKWSDSFDTQHTKEFYTDLFNMCEVLVAMVDDDAKSEAYNLPNIVASLSQSPKPKTPEQILDIIASTEPMRLRDMYAYVIHSNQELFVRLLELHYPENGPLNTFLTLYHRFEEQKNHSNALYALLVALHMTDTRFLMPNKPIHVTEHVCIDSVLQTIFPRHLHLPIYS